MVISFILRDIFPNVRKEMWNYLHYLFTSHYILKNENYRVTLDGEWKEVLE
jgi:hypothetical protein